MVKNYTYFRSDKGEEEQKQEYWEKQHHCAQVRVNDVQLARITALHLNRGKSQKMMNAYINPLW